MCVQRGNQNQPRQGQQQQQASQQQQQQGGQNAGKNNGGKKGARGGKNGQNANAASSAAGVSAPAPVLAPTDFPPLPSVSQPAKNAYAKEFRHYPLEELVKIIHDSPSALKKPPFPNDKSLFLDQPNLTLELEKEKPA